MSIYAFEGAAGCGKTYQLIAKLEEQFPNLINDNGKILALTFMHGSRKRLSSKLSSIPILKKRNECITLDSLAARINKRWSTLRKHFSLPEISEVNAYDIQCGNATRLLQDENVANWFKLSFPIVILDEAQDLSLVRVDLIKEISRITNLFIALDEFQCLVNSLRPNPMREWLVTQCTPEQLSRQRRTQENELLNAAIALRSGNNPVSGNKFKIEAIPGIPAASAFISAKIHYASTKDIAIIVPSIRPSFVSGILTRVSTQRCGTRQTGPIKMSLEASDDNILKSFIDELVADELYNIQQLTGIWNQSEYSYTKKLMLASLKKQMRISNDILFNKEFIGKKLTDIITHQRQHSNSYTKGVKAMTIHQAKNREFEGVIVIWPYSVGGDNEGKRRLLYNAITRSKLWCAIIVQNESVLRGSPFTN